MGKRKSERRTTEQNRINVWPFEKQLDGLSEFAWAIDSHDEKVAWRVMVARASLIDTLHWSGFVRGMFEGTFDHVGVRKEVARFAGIASAMAHHLGYQHRAAFWDAVDSGELNLTKARHEDPTLDGLWLRLREASLVLDERLRDSEGLVDQVCRIYQSVLESHEMGWPWLTAALVSEFFESVPAWMFGVELAKEYELIMPEEAADAAGLTVCLRPHDGETQAEFGIRAAAELRRVASEVEGGRAYRGRPPMAEVIERAVIWYVAGRALRWPIRRIAAYWFQSPTSDDRRGEVRDGIAEAERLLGLSPFVYRRAS